MAQLSLTRRALWDIRGIKAYSVENGGEAVGEEYLDAIEDALIRLRENPRILRTKDGITESLCFYRVRQHFSSVR